MHRCQAQVAEGDAFPSLDAEPHLEEPLAQDPLRHFKFQNKFNVVIVCHVVLFRILFELFLMFPVVGEVALDPRTPRVPTQAQHQHLCQVVRLSRQLRLRTRGTKKSGWRSGDMARGCSMIL